MYIVFGCLGMPFDGNTIPRGQSLGGSETACYYLAKELARRGHRVTVFTNAQSQDQFDGVDYSWAGPVSQQFPIGEYLQAFLERTPVDVACIQRVSGIFKVPHAAKVSFWWLHDLALKRAMQQVQMDHYVYDGTFAVSEWHKDQIVDTWGLDPNRIYVMPNAVDPELYEGLEDVESNGKLRLLYQSRPERGLEHLVRVGGIMDRLQEIRPNAELSVCGYDNTTQQMQQYYGMLKERIKQLPNCIDLGFLSKQELAQIQASSDLLVYSTEFEETSCISAMEAMNAGLPMLASECGALPETCGKGARLIPLKNGKCDEDKFVNFIKGFSPSTKVRMRELQLARAKKFTWDKTADTFEEAVEEQIFLTQSNSFSMTRSMLDESNIGLLNKYQTIIDEPEETEYMEKYQFAQSPETYAAHYDSDEAFADIERDESVDISNNMRYRVVAEEVKKAVKEKEGVFTILDYGCQKGHYVFTLSGEKELKDYSIVGYDISPRVIEWAEEKRLDEFVHRNIAFTDTMNSASGQFDLILLGEILEHVVDPVAFMNEEIAPLCKKGTKIIITTPYGAWEGKDYNKKEPLPRYHLHHFERADLNDMFGHQQYLTTVCVPAGACQYGVLGSFVTSFNVYYSDGPDIVGVPLAHKIDYKRKAKLYVPRQTISYCGIVKDGENTLRRSLSSIKDVADEFVIGVDKNTTDRTRQVINDWHQDEAHNKRLEIVEIDSPLEVGFDTVRNKTVEKARGDWILWMDCDEFMVYPERLLKYVRNHEYTGFGIAQHHMSADPLGVLNTDFPVRLFRRLPYMQFRGFVHEHPEDMENLNKGPRYAVQVPDVQIIHQGYTTEDIRRKRFMRNFPLMQKDRQKYPERRLGQFLWMRDLAHMCKFEIEATQGRPSAKILEWAQEGIRIWEELLKLGDPMADRMIRDGIDYYSTLVAVLGDGFEAELGFHTSKMNGGADISKAPRRKGRFLNRRHFDEFMRICVDEQTKDFDSRYF